jgi:hypothetical protein
MENKKFHPGRPFSPLPTVTKKKTRLLFKRFEGVNQLLFAVLVFVGSFFHHVVVFFFFFFFSPRSRFFPLLYCCHNHDHFCADWSRVACLMRVVLLCFLASLGFTFFFFLHVVSSLIWCMFRMKQRILFRLGWFWGFL